MYNKAAANTNIIVLCLNQPLIKPHHKLPGTTKVVLIVSLLFHFSVFSNDNYISGEMISMFAIVSN